MSWYKRGARRKSAPTLCGRRHFLARLENARLSPFAREVGGEGWGNFIDFFSPYRDLRAGPASGRLVAMSKSKITQGRGSRAANAGAEGSARVRSHAASDNILVKKFF